MSLFAVIGNPVKHSKSPQIHSLFAKQTGRTLEYTAVALEAEEFDAFVEEFFGSGGSGLNVTVPYKGKAFSLAESCSGSASLAQAVNTLFLDAEGRLRGDNTDGIGLVRDIKANHRFDIADRRVLVLGAGGAVRGALAALILEKPALITIANRTISKAVQLQTEFEKLANISAVGFEELDDSSYELVINGTSLSLENQMPPLKPELLAPDCCCYDMMYADSDTVFVRWAKANGATLALDGLGMLVEQAAAAFEIWHGVRPDTRPVIAQLLGGCLK
jgi:shikimate dehydrogenase